MEENNKRVDTEFFDKLCEIVDKYGIKEYDDHDSKFTTNGRIYNADNFSIVKRIDSKNGTYTIFRTYFKGNDINVNYILNKATAIRPKQNIMDMIYDTLYYEKKKKEKANKIKVKKR